MKILHVFPSNSKNSMPETWRKSQILSLNKHCENFYFGVTNRLNLLYLFYNGILIRRFCKSNKIDIVHVHWGTSLSLISVMFSAVPVVISFCGSDLLGSYNSKGKKKIRGEISIVLSQISSIFSNHNIVKSNYLKKHLPKFSQKKTSIIPNGIDGELFFKRSRKASRLKLKIPESKIVILFINSGAWVKNQKMAYSVKEKLHKTSTKYYFLEINNIPQTKMPIYYSCADFLLLTSKHEGSSNALKEALYCDLKVISTPVGDSHERLDEFSECLISSDTEEIVKFIEKNHLVPFSFPNAKKKEISLENISNNIFELYTNIIKSKRN